VRPYNVVAASECHFGCAIESPGPSLEREFPGLNLLGCYPSAERLDETGRGSVEAACLHETNAVAALP
jgi:hypothetical protein